MYIGLHVKCPLFLSDFSETWYVSTEFRKLLKYQISWKSVPWEPSCSMRTDGRTDMTQLKVAFRNFCLRAEKYVPKFHPRVEEWKTNLTSLAILFHFLCAQHVSDINISIISSLRLCWRITTLVVLFSVRCVLEIWCGWFWVVFVLQAEASAYYLHSYTFNLLWVTMSCKVIFLEIIDKFGFIII